MARLMTSGFELNSITAGVEFVATNGTPTISTTTIRTGTFAGRCSSLSSGTAKNFRLQFLTVAGTGDGPYYVRQYLNIATLPSAENRIISGRDSIAGVDYMYITLDNTGVLRLYDSVGVIGSASATLSTGVWYRIEWSFTQGGVGTGSVEAKIDGTAFASSTTRTNANGPDLVRLGGNLGGEAQTTGDWFFDDVAANDSSGSFQTSYPGDGKVIHVLPDAAGDSNQWLKTAGGAGTSTNFQEVDEVTPDDATTMVKTTTLNDIDMYNCAASGIGAGDIVNVVSVGMRYNNDTADTVGAFRVRLEKTGSGTVAESVDRIPNSITWKTNTLNGSDESATIYPLVTYQDPDSANWTQATLDTMQIGIKYTINGAQLIQVSKVWANVDYTPVTFTPSRRRMMTGVGS